MIICFKLWFTWFIQHTYTRYTGRSSSYIYGYLKQNTVIICVNCQDRSDRGLNPRPSANESSALPLSLTDTLCIVCDHVLIPYWYRVDTVLIPYWYRTCFDEHVTFGSSVRDLDYRLHNPYWWRLTRDFIYIMIHLRQCTCASGHDPW